MTAIPPIDVDALRADLATHHGLLIGRDDPVFALVYLNDALLRAFSDHTAACAATMEQAIARACDDTLQRHRHAIGASSTGLVDAIERVAGDVPEIAKAQVQRLIAQAIEPYVREIDARGQALATLLAGIDTRCRQFAAETQRRKRSTWRIVSIVMAVMGVIVAMAALAGLRISHP